LLALRISNRLGSHNPLRFRGRARARTNAGAKCSKFYASGLRRWPRLIAFTDHPYLVEVAGRRVLPSTVPLGNSREALGNPFDATRKVFAKFINPKAAHAPAEALKLQVSPVVIVLAAAASGAVD
jgi:hypothetical protein